MKVALHDSANVADAVSLDCDLVVLGSSIYTDGPLRASRTSYPITAKRFGLQPQQSADLTNSEIIKTVSHQY